MNEDKEKKSLGERVEDGLDEALYRTQNAIYGERKSIDEDIPATVETPSGFRRINKFATRRNIGRTLLKNPKTALIVLGVAVAVVIIIAIVSKL